MRQSWKIEWGHTSNVTLKLCMCTYLCQSCFLIFFATKQQPPLSYSKVMVKCLREMPAMGSKAIYQGQGRSPVHVANSHIPHLQAVPSAHHWCMFKLLWLCLKMFENVLECFKASWIRKSHGLGMLRHVTLSHAQILPGTDWHQYQLAVSLAFDSLGPPAQGFKHLRVCCACSSNFLCIESNKIEWSNRTMDLIRFISMLQILPVPESAFCWKLQPVSQALCELVAQVSHLKLRCWKTNDMLCQERTKQTSSPLISSTNSEWSSWGIMELQKPSDVGVSRTLLYCNPIDLGSSFPAPLNQEWTCNVFCWPSVCRTGSCWIRSNAAVRQWCATRARTDIASCAHACCKTTAQSHSLDIT